MRSKSAGSRRVIRTAVESMESRQLLCYGTEPAGYVPTRLTPGHDHFAEGHQLSQTVTTSGRAGGDASPNLALTDVFMSDADGNEVATPAIGSYAYMVAHFTTTDLPANANYVVRMTVAGQNIDYPITWGAGAAGTGSYVIQLGVWMITSGFKTASVTLDATNTVGETNGADNSGTTNFTPASPSTKFIMPLEGTPWIDWTAVNYVDLALDSNVGDYAGGSWAYDGHNGWDLTTANWRAPDAGLNVYATAPGTVVAAVDGNFDRINTWTNPPQANYVTIDHGNGFTTTYYHLRKYSVTVNVGDSVVAGEQIGLAGSSGRSTNPHLHFGVYYHGMLVEPNISASSYFSAGNTLGYAGDHPTVLDAGVIDVNPTSQEWYEGPPTINTFNPGDTIRTWAMYGGAQNGDTLSVKWYLPGGALAGTSNFALTSAEYQYASATANWTLGAGATLGTWQVAWLLNGVEYKRLDIGVRSTALPAEVQMTDTAGNYIKDGRTTPYDLGTLWEDTPNALPTFSFRVRNRGSSTLTTDSLSVPLGFTVTDGLAASIAPGSFDTVTLRLDDQTPGHKIGWVTFNDSDGDPGEGTTQFRVEGTVNSVTPLTLSDEDADYVYISRSGANTQVWINRSTALSPSSVFPVAESDNWVINTGSGNDTVVIDYSNGIPLQDEIDLNLGFDTDRIEIIGQSVADTILIGGTLVSAAGHTINFTGLNALDIDGGGDDDVISFNLFSGDLDLITFPVTVAGGSGADNLYILDNSDVGTRTYDIEYNHVSRGGLWGGVTFSSLDSVTLTGSDSNSTFNVGDSFVSTTTAFVINAGDGNDSLNLGSGDIGYFDGLVTFDGGVGTDPITVNDSASNNVGPWTITSTNVSRITAGGLDYSGAESLLVLGGITGSNFTVNSTAAGTPLTIDAGFGNDSIAVQNHSLNFEVTVIGGAGDDLLYVNTDNTGTANVRLVGPETFNSITIANGGTVSVAPAANEANVLRTTALAITGTGALDLGNNPMILDYAGATPIETVRTLISTGYNNGAWNGNGIRASSAASAVGRTYGYAEAAAIGSPVLFAGQNIDNTSILFRNTQVGDTDLDRDVDFDDLLRQAQNYGLPGPRYWYQGNFNFDAVVNFDDLLGLAQQYGTAFSVSPIRPTTSRHAVMPSDALV